VPVAGRTQSVGALEAELLTCCENDVQVHHGCQVSCCCAPARRVRSAVPCHPVVLTPAAAGLQCGNPCLLGRIRSVGAARGRLLLVRRLLPPQCSTADSKRQRLVAAAAAGCGFEPSTSQSGHSGFDEAWGGGGQEEEGQGRCRQARWRG
jgi:hypothetical protein